MRNLFRITFIFALSLGVSGCGVDQNGQQKVSVVDKMKWHVSSEKLLAADGFISFAGLNMKKMLPAERHMAARGRVNPSQTKGHLPYTDYLRRADMMAPSHYREVSLSASSLYAPSSFKVASLSSVSGAAGIPAPGGKPSMLPDASVFQVAEAGRLIDALPKIAEGLAPVMAPKPVFSTMRMAAFLDNAFGRRTKVQEILPEETQEETFEIAGLDADVLDDQLSVVNMRMGDYEDKTRLVLDLSAAAKFDYDLNNVNSILTVHINGANWNLETKQYFDDHPLIQSYEVSESKDHDVTLEISLKQPSRMIMSGFVRPDKNRGHRIFFDVAAL